MSILLVGWKKNVVPSAKTVLVGCQIERSFDWKLSEKGSCTLLQTLHPSIGLGPFSLSQLNVMCLRIFG